MNKADLIEAIARYYSGDRAAAAGALDAVLDSIAGEIAAGGLVSVAGFGTFQTVARPPRRVRDPRSGRVRQVKATPIPQFRPAAELRALAAGTKKPTRPVERVVAHKTARAAARRMTRDNQAGELTRHLATFDPRQPGDYLFAADPGSEAARELAAAATAPTPIHWPRSAVAPTLVRQNPKPTSTAPLPRADVLIVTHSPAEAHALADVFTPGWALPRWYPYRNAWQQLKRTLPEAPTVPSRVSDRAGLWATARLGTTSVVLVKTDLHPGTDGGYGPLTSLWTQMIGQVQPRLAITTGAAWGTGDIGVGDVVVSRHLALTDPADAAAPSLAQVAGSWASRAPLRPARLSLVQTRLLPETTSALPLAGRPAKIWTDTRSQPVTVLSSPALGATPATLAASETRLVLDASDAAVGLACDALDAPPAWLSVRAVYATQQHEPTRDSAARSYEHHVHAACLGSALGCWAAAG